MIEGSKIFGISNYKLEEYIIIKASKGTTPTNYTLENVATGKRKTTQKLIYNDDLYVSRVIALTELEERLHRRLIAVRVELKKHKAAFTTSGITKNIEELSNLTKAELDKELHNGTYEDISKEAE